MTLLPGGVTNTSLSGDRNCYKNNNSLLNIPVSRDGALFVLTERTEGEPQSNPAVNAAQEIKPQTSHSKNRQQNFKSLHVRLSGGAYLIQFFSSRVRLASRSRKTNVLNQRLLPQLR